VGLLQRDRPGLVLTMRSVRAGVVGLCLVVLATLMGCQAHPGPVTHAVYVYMCGGDLETNAARGSADLDELIAAVATAPAGTTVVVQTGGAKAWHGHGIDASGLQRWLVTGDGLQLVEATALDNMATAGALAGFLDFAVTGYRADTMSLVLWGHGTGRGVCVDQLYYDDMLDADDIRWALSSLEADVRFETVVFDACYGATVDLAAAVAGRAMYMVAAAGPLPGSGLDYAAIDFAAGGLDRAASIADSAGGPGGPTVSVIRPDRIADLTRYAQAVTGLEPVAAYIANAYYLVDLAEVLAVLPDHERETLGHLLSEAIAHRTDPDAPTAGLTLQIPR